MRRVVIGYDNRVVNNAHIAVKSLKNVFAQMIGFPALVRLSQAPAELMDNGLGNERHCQLRVANLKIQGSSTVPTHCLIGVEKLFDMPAIGVIFAYLFEFVAVRGG